MSEERSGLERLVRRVRNGLDRGRQTLARKVVPITAARSTRAARLRNEVRRQRPYLEALEPRVLLSADVGLVPEALLAPPTDPLDPRTLVQPEIHDDVLVREPSRFEKVAREAFVETKVKELLRIEVDTSASESGEPEAKPVESGEADVKSAAGEAAPVEPDAAEAGPDDPDAAARALRTRIWQAEITDALATAGSAEQVMVVDARIPEIDSILSALLEGVGGDADEVDARLGVSLDGLDEKTSDDDRRDDTDGAGEKPSARPLAEDRLLSAEERATRAEALADALEAKGVAVVVLDAGRDGLDQLTEIARAYQGVGAMHVVSHGARGSLTLGSSRVTTETLRARAGMLAGLRDALGRDGDLLLYGCDVAGGEVGIEFVTTLAELGGVDVGASDDLTGAAVFGGDWDLEVSVGEIETQTIRAHAYAEVLATFTLDGDASLTATLRFDATAGNWFLEGDATFTVSNGTATRDAATGEITGLAPGEDLTVVLGDGDDRIALESVDPSFTGVLTIDADAGNDVLVIDPSVPGDAVTDAVLLGGDGEEDTLDFGSRSPAPALNVLSDGFELEQGDAVDARVVSEAAYDDLLASIRGLVSDADDLAKEGNFDAALAGVRGNVDVTLGGAMDLGEVFQQLAIELETQRDTLLATGSTTVGAVQDLIAGFTRADVTHFDRVLSGAVVGDGDIDSTADAFGFTITLDGGDTLRFGRAADSEGNAIDVGGVRLGAAGGAIPSIDIRREANGKETVTRSTGSWLDDGFRKTEKLTFVDDGTPYSFEIDDISGDGRVLTLTVDDDTLTTQFDEILGRAPTDDDGFRQLDAAAAGAAGFSVANTILLDGAATETFLAQGFREGQSVLLLDAAGATVGGLEIAALSEDGKVLRFEEDASTPDLTPGTRIVGNAIVAGSQNLVGIQQAINTAIGASDLDGRVEAVVFDLASDAPTERSRLGIRVIDTGVDTLDLEWTNGAFSTTTGLNDLGFSSGVLEATSLASELAGLGDLSTAIAPPSAEIETFRPQQTALESLDTTDLTPSSGDVIFEPGADGQGVLVRVDGSLWSGMDVGDTFIVGSFVGSAFNDGTFQVVGGQTTNELVVKRTLAVATSGTTTTLTRDQGSWLADGFVVGQRITVGSDVEGTLTGVTETVLSFEVTTGTLSGTTTIEPVTVASDDAVVARGVVDDTGVRFDFGLTASRDNDFNLALGTTADDKGFVFGSDVGLTLRSTLDASLSITLEATDTTAAGEAMAGVDLSALEVTAGANTPDTDLALLPPAGGDASDQALANALYARNIEAGDQANIGFLGAEVGSGGGYVSTFGSLTLDASATDWTAAGDYTSASHLAVDIPITVQDGIGYNPSGLAISSASEAPAESDDGVVEVGNVFEGANAFGDEDLFRGLVNPDGFDPQDFANLDAPGFVRLLGEIRSQLQRVNNSEVVARFDIPFVREGLGAVTDLANAFGDAVLFDVGDDGRDGDDALVTDVQSALDAAGLGDVLAFEGVNDESGQRFVLRAKDVSITRVVLSGDFFGISNPPGDGRVLEGAVVAEGTLYDAGGILTADQSVQITLQRGTITEGPVSVTVARSDTTSNTKIGNDRSKLLNGDNAPTFTTAQELSKKLIDLAIGAALPGDAANALSFDDGVLTFELATELPLFETEFSVDFDLDFEPVGSLETVGDPKIEIGGEVGFGIKFGIDLRNEVPGNASIDESTELVDLRGVDLIGDLIETRPSITARFVPGTTTVNDPEPEDPDQAPPPIDVSLDRIRMDLDAGERLVFGSGAVTPVSANLLVGNLLRLSVEEGRFLQLQAPDPPGQITSGTTFQGSPSNFFELSLEVPPLVGGQRDAFDFYVGIRDFIGTIPFTSPDVLSEEWVLVEVPTWVASDPDAGTAILKREFRAHVEQAIANAQRAGASNTIARTDGTTWASEGFGIGQTIQVSRAGANDGLYSILDLTTDDDGNSTLVVSGSLATGTDTDAQIEGVGEITLSATDSSTTQQDLEDAIADFVSGDAIRITGSQRNDGSYIVLENRGTSLLVNDVLEREAASDDVVLEGSGGAVRLNIDEDGQAAIDNAATEAEAQALEEDYDARFDLVIDGETHRVVIFREQQEDDPFAPFLADNESPTDLAQDLRSALSRAVFQGAGESRIADLSKRIDVDLDGSRLVMTMARPTLAEGQSVRFDAAGTLTRFTGVADETGGSWVEDGFIVGDVIRVAESEDNDGLFVITGITSSDPDDDELNDVLEVTRLDAGAITSSDSAELDATVERVIGRLASGEALDASGAPASLGAVGSLDRLAGSFRDDGFVIGQLVVVEGAGVANGTYRVDSVADLSLDVTRLSQTETDADPEPTFEALGNGTTGLVTSSFVMENVNRGAQILGFGSATPTDDPGAVASTETHYASLYDFVIALGEDEFLVSLDEAVTVGDVFSRIDEVTNGRVRARIDEAGTAIELITTGVMNGSPRLTFVASEETQDPSATGNRSSITRSEGSWLDDGFVVGDSIVITRGETTGTPQTILFLSSDGERAEFADASFSDEEFVRDAFLRRESLGLSEREAFRVDLINASAAAAGLGILASDAAGDSNQDDVVNAEDRDGVIEGVAVGGSSLLDRLFIEDPEITLDLSLEIVDEDESDNEAAEIEAIGRLGFVEVDLSGRGALNFQGALTLNDPTTPNGEEKITLRDFATGFQNPFDFIATPTFSGGAEVPASETVGGTTTTNTIAFSNTGTGNDARGQLVWTTTTSDGTTTTQGVGDWEDAGFAVNDFVSIRNSIPDAEDSADGIYQIQAIDDNTITLTETFETLPSGTVDTSASGLTILRPIGRFELALDRVALDGIGGIDADDLVGLDPKVALNLIDLGDPFFRESIGAETKSGGAVALAGLDTLTITRGDGADEDEILEDLEEVRSAVANGDEIKVRVTWVDENGDTQSEKRVVKSIDLAENATVLPATVTVVLEEGIVDDTSDVTRIEKIRFTKPPLTSIETPDLTNILDFDDISIRDIIRGLQLASDFLGQFEAFDFLDQPIPVIEVSFNDLLDFADQLAAGLEEIQNDPDGTLQTIEARIEDVLGITEEDPFDIQLSIARETLAARGTEGQPGFVEEDTHTVLKLGLTIGDDFQESIGVEFDIAGGGVLAGAANLEARGSGQIQIDLGLDIGLTEVRGDPTLTVATDGLRRITRSDGAFWADDGFKVGQTVTLKNAGARDGRYSVDSIEGNVIVFEAESEVEIDTAWTTDVPAGLDPIALTGSRAISVFNSTGISATFDAVAEDVDFRAAAGPVGLYIQGGEVRIGGTLAEPPGSDPLAVPPGDPPGVFLTGPSEKIFDAGLLGEDDGRRLLGELLDSDGFAEAFAVNVSAGLALELPVYFPTDSLLQGTVEYSALLELTGSFGDGVTFDIVDGSEEGDPDGLGFQIRRANGDLVAGETAGERFRNFFTFDAFDPRELSLFDNVRLAVDGFDLILGGIQDILDGEILGIELPLIGDSLSDGARFIEDLREDFVEPFRDGLDDAESFIDDVSDPNKNVLSQLLFDELSKTGLLLVTHDRDGNALSDENVFTARADQLVTDPERATSVDDYGTIIAVERTFLLSQVVRLNGTRQERGGSGADSYFDDRDPDETRTAADGDIDLAGIPSAQIRDLAFIEWDFRLGQNLAAVDSDIALDFGIPAVGIEADGALGIELGWDLELGFGLDFRDGFYFDIGSESELQIDVDVVLPDSLSGRVAFLQLDAENLDSGLGATFVVDVQNKSDADDDRLSFTELGKLKLEAGIAAEARADLALELKLNEQLLADFPNVFPTILADFEFDWAIGDRDAGVYENIRDLFDEGTSVFQRGLNTVAFRDVGLDLGSFISDFAKPVLTEIQKVTGPIQPIVDIVTSPLPVLSDLGPSVTLLDLARLSGKFNPALIEAIADIITLVNAIPTDVDTIVIGFGDFVIYEVMERDPITGAPMDTVGVDPTDENADLGEESRRQGANATPNQSVTTGRTASFVDKLKNTPGFEFPILSDPTQIFGLLSGEEVVLFGYDMPPFELDLSYTAFFPLYGPLGIGVTGTAAAKIDFAFGFDSSGLQRFLESGFTNPVLIFDGFYVSDNPEDVTGAGPDLNELEFDLGFFLSAELNLGIARAGVAGGIEAGIDFDLFDPNRDGKIRIGEIFENVENEFLFGNPILSPLAIFDVSGIVTARAFAFLEINLLLLQFDIEFNITPVVTLVEFDVDFTRAPKLGTVLDDGMLQLNMGDFAGERLNGDLRDVGEHFHVELNGSDEVRVTWVGSNPGRRDFFNDFDLDEIVGVLAIAGEGDDTIAIGPRLAARAGMRYQLDGGVGNDRIIAGAGSATANQSGGDRITSVLRGGDGADEIIGTIGDDEIFGGVGSDRIFGGGGDDVIFGDLEQVVQKSPRVRNARVEVSSSGSTASITLLDSDVDFADEGFAVGQTITLDRFAERGAAEADLERLYVVTDVLPATELDGATLLVETEDGEPVGLTAADDSTESGFESRVFTIAADGVEFLSSYKSQAGGADGADVVLGGDGDDWIFGAGGADVLIGGDDGLGTAPASTAPSGYAASFDDDFDVRAGYLNGTAVDPDDVAGTETGADIIVGDGGEIRLNIVLDGQGGRPSPRSIDVSETRLGGAPIGDNVPPSQFGTLVEATDRGLAFGDDRIYGSGGNDLLFGGRGDDLVYGGDDDDVLYGEVGRDRIDAGAGDDVVFGGRDDDDIAGNAGDDLLFGEGGADIIAGDAELGLLLDAAAETRTIDVVATDVGSGDDYLFGDAGADQLAGGGGADTIRGGADNDLILGGTGGDDLFGEAGDDRVLGGAGRDDIEVRGGSDFVDGGEDGDDVFVKFKGGENTGLITIYDSAGAASGSDTLRIAGTAGDDQFLLRTSTRQDGEVDETGSPDIGFVASIVEDEIAASRNDDFERFFVERVDYDGIEQLDVDGGYGDDRFALDDTHRTTLTLFGGGGDDFFQVGQLYRSRRTAEDANIADRDVFPTAETTRGFLSNGISNAATINAGNDNDTIIVFRNLGVLTVNGQAGDDLIEVRAFALVAGDPEQESTEISGGAGVDRIRYAVNAPVNIDGGDGTDTVSVIGTEFADEFVITKDGVFGAGLNVNFVNVELLRVDGAEGDDRFYVQSTNEAILTQIFGGLGSDTISVGDGEQRAVTSNDLLGHSGVIVHDVESNDEFYAGPNESADGIRANGVSVNVRDDDEPGILLSELGGFARIAEGGAALTWYDVVLTRAPEDEVVVFTANAPTLSEEDLARGERLLGLTLNADGTGLDKAVQLTFDATNWDVPQRIFVSPDVLAEDDVSTFADTAREGERFGVIQHVIATVPLPDPASAAPSYDQLQAPTIAVLVADDDIADVVIDRARDLTVYESNGGAETSQIVGTYDVSLARDPRGGETILVELEILEGADGQIELSTDGTTWTSDPVTLSFTEGGASQEVFVRGSADPLLGSADGFREGFHRGLIQHRVLANAGDVDVFVDAGTGGSGETFVLPAGVDETDTLLLASTPLQFRGEVDSAPPGSPDPATTIVGFDDVSFTVADLAAATADVQDLVVRITNGTGAGQIRGVVSISGNVVTVDEAWDEAPDETSRFSMSGVRVFVTVDGTETEIPPERYDLNGSSVVFFDEDFIVETRTFDSARVQYRSLDPGYSELEDQRISVSVVDGDTAGILVVESDGRTDVVEGASGTLDPAEGRVFDRYTISLSRAPEWSPDVPESERFLRVYVDPTPTPTSGQSVDRIQVEVRRTDGSAPVDDLATNPTALQLEASTGRAFFDFTADNWSISRTVEVVAIDDDVVDGQETQVFAPRTRTLFDIAGPLLVDGRGGQGSLEGLGQPVLLPDSDGRLRETNLKAPTGGILDLVDGPAADELSFLVDRTELDDYVAGRGETLADLTDRTLEIVRGEGIDQFRLVRRVEVVDASTYAVVVSDQLANPNWTLDQDQVDEANGSAYAITTQSLNFFVLEEEQQDVLLVSDADSPADSSGEMIALDFDDFPAMETVFNGSLDPSDPAYVVPNRITGFNMGVDTTIARGLRPGGITYLNFEGLELDLGYGDNVLFVDTIHERSDEVETFTRIRTGRGDDTIDVSLQNGTNADGRTPWIEIDAGIGDDRIDASETNAANGEITTIPLNLIGGLGEDTIIGGDADDLIFGDFGSLDFTVPDPIGFDDQPGIEFDQADVDARTPEERFVVETLRTGDGGNDRLLEGRGGNDRIFGGAGSDIVRGEDDGDVLFGDYGKITRVDGSRTTLETIDLFQGAADVVDGGAGGDFIFGGAAGDALIGNLRDDLLIGEYARLNLFGGVGTSIVRLGQGNLDVAAATFFGLYDPRFGPFAEFVLPEQVAAGEDLAAVAAARPPIDLAAADTDARRDAAGGAPAVTSYDVRSGDTLWDIARTELGDAYRWVEIHSLNQDLVADPDLILPEEALRIPGQRALTPEELEAQRLDVADMRQRLDDLDEANRSAAEEGWGFFNPLAVGAGPPEQGETESPDEVAPAPAEDAPVDPTGDDRGALRLDDGRPDDDLSGDDEPELSALILSSLAGWRRASGPGSAHGRGKWLRFDADTGRFA